ncbi:unnamed protein product [Blepharisma stoltei]|uniref:Calcium-dependent phosphotriesterase n=1 Tax=Blepharisma stoltei TaxID=1481888 RepID=A0AAU9IK08_9CILI|nr:unnamed protein product [Blepharisma stoltei]
MSKILLALFSFLAIVGWLQYRRILHPDKDVVLHHYESCSRLNSTGSFIDFTYYEDSVIAAEDDLISIYTEGPKNAKSGRLLLIEKIASNNPTITELSIQNFPADVGFHPFALYLVKPNTLYVLNHAFHEGGTRVEIFNITETTANYYNFFNFYPDLQGIFGDFIIDTDNEAYFTQFTPIPMPSDGGPIPVTQKFLTLLSDILQLANTYIYYCKFSVNSTADCMPLNQTEAISITGITKNKFGDYYVAYSSIDYNWISEYTKSSNGNLNEKFKLGLRDRTEKILYDEYTQRVYGGAVPWQFQAFGDGSVVGGAIEVKDWEHKTGLVYRRLFTQEGIFKGASCAIRIGDYVLTGSYLDKGGLICPIVSPKN